jgi:putative transposase
MPEYRRAWLGGGTFFFTVVTYKRHPIFEDKAAIDLLNRCFQAVASEYPYNIETMVVLPDHLHCIWTLPDSDFDFSTRWKRIKTAFTRSYSGGKAEVTSESMRKKKEAGVWQRRFWEHRIRDQDDLNRHCDYIHYNPVKHKLVNLPVEWKHSSFREFVEKGFYDERWGDTVQEELLVMDLE